MTNKELMLSEQLYMAEGEELEADFRRSRRLMRLFNTTTEEQMEYRIQLIKELFGSTGEHIWIEPPFRCDSGCHIYVGDHFYANYDCIILDVCDITIGEHVILGPRVNIFAAGHPIDASVRNTDLEFGKRITIGDNVWIGGNTVINPGVTIGSNVVIGSGSVVTKDIPDNVVAVGNPCHVLREVTEQDHTYWKQKETQYYKNISN